MGWARTTRPRREGGDGRISRGSGLGRIAPVMLAGDASFRRYYRLTDAGRRAVLMDAPPPMEDVGPYVAVAEMLRDLGLSAPEIYAEDRQRGFLLIEDFGDNIYTRLAGARRRRERALCARDRYAGRRCTAPSPSAAARRCRPTTRRGCSTRPRCWPTGTRRRCSAQALPDAGARRIPRALAAHPAARRCCPAPTLVLRDYHVDNLMLLPGRSGVRACGLLDFQDAVCGPAELRSRLAARGRPPRRAGRPARRDDRALSRVVSGTRPRRLLPLRRDPGGAAQLQDHRHLHAAVAARRQARLSRPHPARLAAARRRSRREPALRPIADWLDRTCRKSSGMPRSGAAAAGA